MAALQESREVIRAHLDRLLAAREPPKTICPSEVARALSASELEAAGVDAWRDLMPTIRSMVAQMRDNGEVTVLQRGQTLRGDLGEGLSNVTGPIRVRTTRTE